MAIDTSTLMSEIITVRTTVFICGRVLPPSHHADSTPPPRGIALAISARMVTAVRVLLFRRSAFAPALALVAFLPTRQPIISWPSGDPLDSIWEEPVDL